MMMIAFSTFKSSLVLLLEGLWSSNSWEFELSGFRRNRTDDLGIDSPSLWPAEPRLHVRSTGYMFVTHMEFLILLWWSLCVGLTQEVNLSQTMPRGIRPDVNSLTLSISVSLWAGTTLTDIMKRLALDAAIERKAVKRHACSSALRRRYPKKM